MLRMYFELKEQTVFDVDIYFRNLFRPEWLQDPLVTQMIKDVDKSDVLSPYCIQSPVLGQIPPTTLSGGVQALILMLKTDFEIWASTCGDNCAKWILEIANKRAEQGKDLTICLEHYLDFGYWDSYYDTGKDLEFFCVDTNKIEGYEAYTDKIGMLA